jgi:hypothetical protein
MLIRCCVLWIRSNNKTVSRASYRARFPFPVQQHQGKIKFMEMIYVYFVGHMQRCVGREFMNGYLDNADRQLQKNV